MHALPCRDSEITNQLWIGLYDKEHFYDETQTCTCSLVEPNACRECRNRFVWVDGTSENEDFALWSGSEPQFGEKCGRLTNGATNQRWSGSPCSTEIDYVCSRGIYLDII